MNEFALVLPACREKEVIRLAHEHYLSFRSDKDRKTHQFFVLLPKKETESQMSHQYLQFVSND